MAEQRAGNSIIGSSEWLEKMRKMEADLRDAKAARRPEVREHVGLDQADKEARLRRRSHPTSGSTRSIPDRWTSAGPRPKAPGEEF